MEGKEPGCGGRGPRKPQEARERPQGAEYVMVEAWVVLDPNFVYFCVPGELVCLCLGFLLLKNVFQKAQIMSLLPRKEMVKQAIATLQV